MRLPERMPKKRSPRSMDIAWARTARNVEFQFAAPLSLKGSRIGTGTPSSFTRADKEVTEVSDVIHGPSHYSWRECGESLGFIKRFISNQPDSFLAFCEGNVFKYLYRYPKKNGVEDLKKAREYLNRMIEHMEDEK